MNSIERSDQDDGRPPQSEPMAHPTPITDEPHVEAELAARRDEPVMDLMPERGFGHISHAVRDIRESLRLFRLGWTLGWLDIKLRYRGSLLGPFWVTISTVILVAAMGMLYATLLHTDLKSYLPFLCFSLVLWAYLGGTVTDGCAAFTNVSGLIHAVRMPFSVHVMRVMVRNFLTFLHSVGVIIVLFAVFRIAPTLNWSLPTGVCLWMVDLYALTLTLGVLGARFRDMPPIAGNILQILFFVTPILWKPDLIYMGRQYMLLDPCYPLIEIVRGPFMGTPVRPSIWLMASIYSVVLWVVSFLLFARMRGRLAYWV
ncbi:ABC transporter permease [Acetobacter conturbans]|uniref:ABC transporter permease n=1 Tax=Acetobacter conturbans TaxID=1737472 RepID=A0ABX0JXM1_9PROT|nr:ABC transporter permease [Acetobacter conturbans]NHN87627.1 ABC transporter permease [Acetobacter conturbans]